MADYQMLTGANDTHGRRTPLITSRQCDYNPMTAGQNPHIPFGSRGTTNVTSEQRENDMATGYSRSQTATTHNPPFAEQIDLDTTVLIDTAVTVSTNPIDQQPLAIERTAANTDSKLTPLLTPFTVRKLVFGRKNRKKLNFRKLLSHSC